MPIDQNFYGSSSLIYPTGRHDAPLGHIITNQGFQYFSSVPVLHYLQVQAVLCIIILTFLCISYILYNTAKNREVPKTILNE